MKVLFRRSGWIAGTAVIVASALTLAACGGGSDESSSTAPAETASESAPTEQAETEAGPADSAETQASDVPTEAQTIVEAATAPISEWPGPTSSPPIAQGKSIVHVTCQEAAPACAALADAGKEAAERIGWDYTIIDGQGTPEGWNRAIQQAINLNPDAIFLHAIPDVTVSAALQDASEAGIPVLNFGSGSVPKEGGVTVEVPLPWTQAGELVANYIIANSDGEANVGIVNDPEFGPVRDFIAAAERVLTEDCSGCTIVEKTNTTLAELQTKLGPRTVAIAQANPEMDWMIGPYDYATDFMARALQGAGLTDIRLVSGNADPVALDDIRQGLGIVATTGTQYEWGGYAMIDQANRLFNDEEPLDDPRLPVRLFVQENLPPENYWDGDINFREEYLRLWGVEE